MHDGSPADEPSPHDPASGRQDAAPAVIPVAKPAARPGAVPPPPPPAFIKAPPPPPIAAASGPQRAAASLFDLDVPLQELRAVAAPAPAPAEPQRSDRSRSDWMFELDAPARTPSSKDLELDQNAIEAAAQAAAQADAEAEALQAEAPREAAPDPATIPGLEAEMRRVAMPTPVRPDTKEGQLQRRIDRLALRIQTCRDALRIIGTLDLKDEERKPVARQLLELGVAAFGPAGGSALIKEPDAALASASAEQVDELERALGPIEDKLIALDELVPAATFEARVDGGKHGKKAIARYGRLLASRRMNSRERRNRFEWIANRLLAKVDDAGMREALPPARARQVLDHLVGGLTQKIDEAELADALEFMRESLRRLQSFNSHDEFFESEFYFDAHGHKVTMRDMMVAPEYLYMTIVLNVHIHNRIEGWIADRDRLLNSNQVRGENSLRGQVQARMRQQEDAVEEALGFQRKAPVVAAAVRSNAPKPAAKPARKARKRSFDLGIGWDRNLAVLLLCTVVVLGSGGYVAFSSGAVGAPAVKALTRAALEDLSPLLARGWYVGEGQHQLLRASMRSGRWAALEPRQRREQADQLASILKSRGIHNAEISDNNAVIIAIRDGFVEKVQGGKL